VLLLVTVALVFAGLVLLIVGFVQDSLSLIYLSIACAAVAGLALIVFSRLSRRRAVRLAIDGVPAAAAPAPPLLTRPGGGTDLRPRPAPERQAEPTYQLPAEPEPVGAAAGFSGYEDEEEEAFEPSRAEPTQPVPAYEPEPVPELAHAGAQDVPDAGHWEERGTWEEEWGDEVLFPIEDYDDLRVAEILPLLPQLEADELEDVRDREVNTKARATIVAKIDELLGREPEVPAGAPPARVPATAPRAASGTAAKKAAAGRVAPGTSKRAASPTKAAASSARGSSRSSGEAAKAAAPSSGSRSVGGRSGGTRTPASSASATAKKAAAGSKATASGRASTAKKAAASKTGAAKSAASKSAASRTGASKTAASKTAASKATASKTPAGKAAAAKKAPVKTATTSSKAAQPAKKAATKKSGGRSETPPRKR
jgi:hypothetical protein